MKISQRAQSITPFLAMEFGKHAADLEATGHHVVKLNLGEPDFGAPPAVLAELQRVVQQQSLPYTGALGLPALAWLFMLQLLVYLGHFGFWMNMSLLSGFGLAVLLLVRVSASGQAEAAQIRQSSGFERLDEAALAAVRRCFSACARRAGG